MSRVRQTLLCAGALLLAWSEHLIARLIAPSTPAAAIDLILPTVLFLVGCYFVWRVAFHKKSSLSWPIAALAALGLADPIASLLDSGFIIYFTWLLPFLLTFACVAIVAEPHVTARLAMRYEAACAGFALIALIAWGPVVASGSAPLLLAGPEWAAGGLLAELGLPSAFALLLARVALVGGLWYLFARTVVAYTQSARGHLTSASS